MSPSSRASARSSRDRSALRLRRREAPACPARPAGGPAPDQRRHAVRRPIAASAATSARRAQDRARASRDPRSEHRTAASAGGGPGGLWTGRRHPRGGPGAGRHEPGSPRRRERDRTRGRRRGAAAPAGARSGRPPGVPGSWRRPPATSARRRGPHRSTASSAETRRPSSSSGEMPAGQGSSPRRSSEPLAASALDSASVSVARRSSRADTAAPFGP